MKQTYSNKGRAKAASAAVAKEAKTSHAVNAAQREQLLAELACDFLEKTRSGALISLDDYLNKCPDSKAQHDFLVAINMSALVDASIAHRLNGLLKESGTHRSLPA